jgi:hypothetical protein
MHSITFLIFLPNDADQLQIRKDFCEDDIASIYDMQQMGFSWSDKFDESASICRYVINNYPNTLAATTCLRYYAYYMTFRQKVLAKNSPGIKWGD